jgi:hypothetical protein
MTKQEFIDQVNKSVEYLKKVVPPDDIYLYTEQTYMAALFFLMKLSDWVEINDECIKDPVLNKYVNNIMGYLIAKEKGDHSQINLSLDCLD